MSIRSLAASLGVAPMSLYRHIRDKDDLLSEVTDQLLADAWRPAAAEDDWQAWIIEAASRLREFLVSQPAALHVYLRHPTPVTVLRGGRLRTADPGIVLRAGDRISLLAPAPSRPGPARNGASPRSA
jgi:AcrR family transcriptional regulator